MIRRSPRRSPGLRCWGPAGCSTAPRSSGSTSCPVAAGPSSAGRRSRCGNRRTRSTRTLAIAKSRRCARRCSRARPWGRRSPRSIARWGRWWCACRGEWWRRWPGSRGSGWRICCSRGCRRSRKCGRSSADRSPFRSGPSGLSGRSSTRVCSRPSATASPCCRLWPVAAASA